MYNYIEDELRIISIDKEKIIQLNILNTIREFCNSHRIRYYLLYGTLLGAVRHKGFIPWDDDIDIGMLREDYNRFFSCFNQLSKDENSKYEAINIDTNSKYYLPMGKVIDRGTVLIEEVNVDFPLGVFVDVFPIDYLPESKRKCVEIVREIGFFERLLAYKQCFWSEKYSLIKNLFHFGMKALLLPFSSNRICKWINSLASTHGNENSKYIGSIVLGIYGEKGIWNREDFDNEKLVVKEFEGKEHPVPCGYDHVLCRIYDDYMTLPPKEKQVSHHKNNAYWRYRN